MFDGQPQVWSTEDVLEVEERVRRRLPEPYRRHLLETGSGRLIARIVPGTNGDGLLEDLLDPYMMGVIANAVAAGTTAGWELIPDRFMAIGSGAGGALCLGLRDGVDGQLFWADFDRAGALGLIDESPVPDQRCEQMMAYHFADWGSFCRGVQRWEPL